MTDPATTLDRFKEHLNKTEGTDDAELGRHIAAATRIAETDTDVGIGAIVNREVTATVSVGAGIAILPVGPIVSVTSLAGLSGSPVADLADLDIDAEAGVVRGITVALTDGRHAVTYIAGRAATTEEVPEDIQLAVCIIGKHLWETQRGRNANRVGTPADGEKPTMGYLIPHRAAAILRANGPWVGIG